MATDINRDFNRFNDVAPGTTRNEFRFPTQSSLDPRVARNIGLGGTRELTLIWEAFNLLNSANYNVVNNTLYTVSGTTLTRNPLFGQRTGQGGSEDHATGSEGFRSEGPGARGLRPARARRAPYRAQ